MSAIPFRPGAGLLIGLTLFAACAQDPAKKFQGHFDRGNQYVAEKKLAEAEIEFRGALVANPASGPAHYNLAETYAALGKVEDALAHYIRAADLQPDNVDAQLKAGNLLNLSRNFDEARTRARQILEKDPRNTSALLLLGNALAGLRLFDEAVAANERAVALDPGRSGLYRNLGTLQFLQGNRKEAEAAFLTAVEIEPRNPVARLSLGYFYWAAGNATAAEREFKKALELDPVHVDATRTLARFYTETGRAPLAEPLLKGLASRTRTLTSHIALSDYYVATGRIDDALGVLGALATDPRTFSAAKMRIALISYLRGQHDAATRDVDDVLARDPKNASAFAYKAHFALAGGRLTDAEAAAEAAVAADHTSVRAHFAMGKVHQARGRVENARKAFQQVMQLDPESAEGAIELSTLHLSRSEIDTAIQFGELAVRHAPNYLEAYIVHARALSVRPADRDRAEAVIATMLKRFPKAADTHVVMGELALAAERRDAARQAFERASALAPENAAILNRLVYHDLSAGRGADARRRVDAALARAPKSPELLVLAGKTYAASGQFDVAIGHLKRALELDASNLGAYTALAGVYIQQRRLGDAQREFMELARLQPQSAAPATMVGLIYDIQGRQDDAEAWYQKALTISPRAAAAANNLAWIWAERGVKLDSALELAQVASGQLPNQPEVADTLAWVYYKKELYTMAIPPLERAMSADRQNAVYPYHLGLVYHKRGEDRKARTYLEQALQLDKNFRYAEDARRVLKSLVY